MLLPAHWHLAELEGSLLSSELWDFQFFIMIEVLVATHGDLSYLTFSGLSWPFSPHELAFCFLPLNSYSAVDVLGHERAKQQISSMFA